jgi:hypothetical protein
MKRISELCTYRRCSVFGAAGPIPFVSEKSGNAGVRPAIFLHDFRLIF